MNVGSHLTKRAILDPGLKALVDVGADVRYAFAELDERANRSAHVLAELGLSKGDRVAVLLPNGHQLWRFSTGPHEPDWSWSR
jgi:acyl-CoA synthetase (AMP-forming)/AMP-acid ligase II